MTKVQKTLLLQIKEAAFDQPHPTDALRKTLLMYQGFEAGEAIRVKAIVAAKSRRYKAKKHRAEVLAISSGYAEGGLGGTPFGV